MSSQWKLVPVEPTQSILDAMTTERKKGNGVLQMWFEAMAAAPAPPIPADSVDFGIDERSVRVSQEAYSIFLAREAAGREKIEALQQRLNAADQRIDELSQDKTRLDALESNCWDVRFDSSPNGDAGDSSINIEIVGHWMDKPTERVIGEDYSENLRAAIDQAMTALAYPPARPEYPELDEMLEREHQIQ
ncbi:hypothetical protein AB4P95_11690 [Pseudomonas sp. A1437]|uniref:hypothetical protein n=1 Tax=unclassified Pseudomonas TaxID=196821 RepID=UPI00378314CE